MFVLILFFITLFINEGTPDNQTLFIFERFSNIGHLFLSLQVVRDKNIIEVLLTFCVYVFLNALKLSYMSIFKVKSWVSVVV